MLKRKKRVFLPHINKSVFRLKKLHIYIVNSFIGTFILTFLIVVFVFLMQFLWLYVDDFVGKGLELDILMKLFFYMSTTFVPMALPLAILLASLMSFGNMGEHYELVAMKASGISIWKVMRPLVYFSVLMSIFAFVFSNSILPVTTLKSKVLLFDVRKQKLAFDIKEGIFYKDMENYVIYVGKKGKDGSSIYDVKIYDHSEHNGNTRVMTADSGMMRVGANQRSIVFTLYDGYDYTDVTSGEDYKTKRPFERLKFKEERITLSLEDFDMKHSDEEMYKSHQAMMNINQLKVTLDSLNVRYDQKKKYFAESFMLRMSHAGLLDSIAASDTATLVSDTLSWPLLDKMGAGERAYVVDMALNMARNAKDNVNFNKVDITSQKENIKKHQKEFHKKFTLSFACLIFFFIGAPLGTIMRRGGFGLPVVISVLFFVFYYVTSTMTERMAVYGDLNMFFGVWTSSLILLPIGIFLTIKATSDSQLLDGEGWNKAFSKIAAVFKKQKQ